MRSDGEEQDSANRVDRLRPIAAAIVRGWARKDMAAIALDVGAVGRLAADAGAKAISRLPGSQGPEASRALATLNALVEEIGDPPRKRWSFRRSLPIRARMPTPVLVDMIERDRDEALRRTMTLREDRRRLEAGVDALREALGLIVLLDAGALAVAREVAIDDPTRAEKLRTEVRMGLSERERDLRLQLVVLRQAMATHDLVADGHTALAEALDRAREITVGAVQTAVAARAAVGADDPSSDRPGTEGRTLADVVARLHAVLDRRERG